MNSHPCLFSGNMLFCNR